MEMAARKRPPCLAAESAVLSLAPSLFSQTFCLSCLLGAASEMRSGGFVTRTVCSMLEVKSVSPICFNFVKRSKQCYQWISVILGSSNVYRRFQNIPRSSWHHPQDIFQHDDRF
ncbi:unnamed protein product [Sphagnum jensenii]|uniref:Secreted protein n=1 Tax=Sphagnum jensenii TaxID=128206 RepID=A0ABP0W3L4_9BRYO